MAKKQKMEDKPVKEIDLRKIKYYCLATDLKTPRQLKRNKHIKDTLKGLDVTFVINSVPKEGYKSEREKFKYVSLTLHKLVERALREQDPNKPFTPFMLLEDDISFYNGKLPETINIPTDSDMYYAGLSDHSWGGTHHTLLHYEPYNEEVIRIYNMLSTHSLLICSPLAASIYQGVMLENFYWRGMPWDIPIADVQSKMKVYAGKKPLFYQDHHFGGQEIQTRIEFEDGCLHYMSPLITNKKPKMCREAKHVSRFKSGVLIDDDSLFTSL